MFLPVIQTAVLALALIVAHPASADFEAGQRALDAGNAYEALSQWQDAANAGDGRAMLALGRLYLQGLGVIQDYVEAHKWFNLAASRGVAEALEERDALSAKMTPEQVATAQARAAAWQPGGGVAQGDDSSSVPAADTGEPPQQAIRAAQSLLAALGYQPGPADGIWGQGTRAAYQAFLRDAGLPAAETLTPQALRAMQAAAERRGVAQADPGTTAAPSETSAPRPAPVRPDALHQAAKAGDIEGLKAALAAGADVDTRDGKGWTALMHAANKGYPQLAGLLLEAKADPDIQAPDGATALFIAAVQGQAQVVILLIDAGADISIQGPRGKTVTDVARLRGDSGIIKSLPAAAVVAAEMEMVSIPGGTFRMGDLSGEGDDDELPVHSVTVPAFRLGKYEVTFAQWDACVADGGCGGYSPDDKGWGRGNRPVIYVSRYNIQAYIAWLNGGTGGNYRLPTEVEWEYAARAGSTTEYSWGDDIGSNRANCDGCGSRWDDEKTAPVGSFPANAWGLHDMHGNVWEWVQDCWNESYEGAPSDGSAWESGNCAWRVLRGGAWYSDAWDLRSANRIWVRPRVLNQWNYGFRLAQDR